MDGSQLKGIFKPTLPKVLLFLMFVLFNAWLIYMVNPVWPFELILPEGGTMLHYGLPFNFYEEQVGCNTFPPESEEYRKCPHTSMETLPLVLDVCAWYIAACLVIYFYQKVRTVLNVRFD